MPLRKKFNSRLYKRLFIRRILPQEQFLLDNYTKRENVAAYGGRGKMSMGLVATFLRMVGYTDDEAKKLIEIPYNQLGQIMGLLTKMARKKLPTETAPDLLTGLFNPDVSGTLKAKLSDKTKVDLAINEITKFIHPTKILAIGEVERGAYVS